MTLAVFGFVPVFCLYWLAPKRFNEPVLIAAGVVGLAWYSLPAALATAALVMVVWIGIADGGSRSLAALLVVVAASSGN